MQELKRYFSYMGKNQYKYWIILITTIIIRNILDVLYSYANKMILNAVEYRNIRLFYNTVILCVIVIMLRCIFPYMRYLSIRLVRKMVFDIKISLFDKLLKLDMRWYENNHSGEGLKTINWDANSLKDSWFSHVYWVLGNITVGITSIIAMFIYSPTLAAISVVISIVTAVMSIKVNDAMKNNSKSVQTTVAELTKLLSDILSGFPVFKLYSGFSIVTDKFAENVDAEKKKEMERVRKASVREMLCFLMGVLGSLGTIFAGVYLVSKGRMDYGTVMAVVTLQISLSEAMQKIGGCVAVLNNSLVKASRVFDFMECKCEENTENIDWKSADNINDKYAETNAENHGKTYIDIDKLTFCYDGTKRVIDNLNLHTGENEKIMIKGESGCGKSTLLKLLLRFYDYEYGNIKINGNELKNYPVERLREMITYIPQDCYLFEGTIAENISYGVKAQADSTDIINAAKLAFADEFITKLSDGYNTKIKSGGTDLSGGQRQRIVIARAFLKDSPILLMDEPSSALDTYSESMIQKSLETLMKDKLVIMVSHREGMEGDFDRVIAM